MDQNQQKSVWLKLVLPICLGVFATAIYHNAIKTQRSNETGFVAKKMLEAGKEIEKEKRDEFLSPAPMAFHRQSASSIKDCFKAGDIKKAFPGSMFVNRQIQEGDFVSKHDFRSAR